MPPDVLAVRPARRDDAAHLARFVDLASEGLVRQVWAGMAEAGEDLMAVGARRAARDEGAFSWRNAAVAEVGGAVAGGLVTYRIGDEPEPLDEVPPLFLPLQVLENRALGSQYVNVVATYRTFRRRGVGRALLAEAGRRASGRRLSLIVGDANLAARRLYAAHGFRDAASEPVVATDGWSSDSRTWVLMVRPAGGSA